MSLPPAGWGKVLQGTGRATQRGAADKGKCPQRPLSVLQHSRAGRLSLEKRSFLNLLP